MMILIKRKLPGDSSLNTVKQIDLDILYFEASKVFTDQKKLKRSLFPQFLTLYHRHKEYDGVYDGKNLYIEMENEGDIKMSVCLQFVRRQFLIDNNIKFGEERYFEG
ncbi:MAG: hypothetical protein ACLVIY_01525 [Anaerobutyricum soehngenii]